MVPAAEPGWRDWLGPLRLPFLLLPLSCVLLGAACLHAQGLSLDLWRFGAVLLGAVSAHLSVNAFNEWFDFRSGLDANTQRTPFSGGSGTLPRRPQLASYVLAVAVGALLLTAALGLWLMAGRAWLLFLLGGIGLLLVIAYSPWLVRRPWLCLIAPGLGFGPLMIVGTVLALGGRPTPTVWWASALPFWLANDLLLLNQFPDLEPDRQAGRRNLPILYGRKAAALIYILMLLAALLSLLAALASGVFPWTTLLVLLLAPMGVLASRDALRYADEPLALLLAMRLNVMLNLLAPLLLALGFWLA